MKFFLKFTRRPFSSTKETFKKIVEYSEIDTLFYKKEKRLFETLCTSIEKQNLNKYIEIIDVYEKHKMILSSDEINQILSYICSQRTSFDFLDRINNYTFDNDIVLDSLSYSFIINTMLKFKGFFPAYNIFFKAKLEKIKVDLGVYYNLFLNLEKIKNNQSHVENSRNFIIHSFKKEFDEETIKNFEKFTTNFQEKTSKRNRNKEQVKQESENLNKKLEGFHKVPSNIIVISHENKGNLVQDTRLDKPCKETSQQEKLKTYKDFHKVSKKLKLKDKLQLHSDQPLKTRQEIFLQFEQLIKELNINKNTEIDLNRINADEVEKYNKLAEYYDRLKPNNELNPQIISKERILSGMVIMELIEQVRKKYLNKIDDGNSFGDDL